MLKILFNDSFKNKLKTLGNSVKICKYSLEAERGNTNFTLRELLENQKESTLESSELYGFFNNNKLHILISGDNRVKKEDNTYEESPFNIIRFFDEFGSAFIIINQASSEDIGLDQEIDATYINAIDYISNGKNIITINFPFQVNANIDLDIQDDTEFLEGPGSDLGKNLFKDSGENNEVSLRSFENYIEKETSKFTNSNSLDELGRTQRKDYTFKIYSNLKITCDNINNDMLVPTRFGLSYYGGILPIRGTVDFIEYRNYDGVFVETGRGQDSIDRLSDIKLITDDNTLISRFDRLNVHYNAQGSSDLATIHASLEYYNPIEKQNIKIESEPINITNRKDSPEFIVDIGTEYSEYYDEFGNIPVYLFEHTQGYTQSFSVTSNLRNLNISDFIMSDISDLFDYTIVADNNKFTITFQTLTENIDTTWKPKYITISSLTIKTYTIRFILIQKAKLSTFDLYSSDGGSLITDKITIPFDSEKTLVLPVPNDDGPNENRDHWIVTEVVDEMCGYDQMTVTKDTGEFGEYIEIDTSSYIPSSVWKKTVGRIGVGRYDTTTGFLDYWKFHAGLVEKSYVVEKEGIPVELELLTDYEYNGNLVNRVINNNKLIVSEINVYGFIVRSNGPFVCYIDSPGVDLLIPGNTHSKFYYSENYDNVEGIKIYLAARKVNSPKAYAKLGTAYFGIPKTEYYNKTEYNSEDFLYEKTFSINSNKTVIEPEINYLEEDDSYKCAFINSNTDSLIKFTSTRTPNYKTFDINGVNEINSVVIVEDGESGGTRGDSASQTSVIEYQEYQGTTTLDISNIEDIMTIQNRYLYHQQLIKSDYDSSGKYYYPTGIRSIVQEYNGNVSKDFYVFLKKLPPKLLYSGSADFGNIIFMDKKDTSVEIEIYSRYEINKSDIKFIDNNSLFTNQVINQTTTSASGGGDDRGEGTSTGEVEQGQLLLEVTSEQIYSETHDYRYRYVITVNIGTETITDFSKTTYIGTLRTKSRIYADNLTSLIKEGRYSSMIPDSLEISQDYIDTNIESPAILDIGIYLRGDEDTLDLFPKGKTIGDTCFHFDIPGSGGSQAFTVVPKELIGEYNVVPEMEFIEGSVLNRFLLRIASRTDNITEPLLRNYMELSEDKDINIPVQIQEKTNTNIVTNLTQNTEGGRGSSQSSSGGDDPNAMWYSSDLNEIVRFHQSGIDNGIFLTVSDKQLSPELYLGNKCPELVINVKPESNSLRIFAGVFPINIIELEDQTKSGLLVDVSSDNDDLNYNFILDSDNEYTYIKDEFTPNLEFSFPINLTFKTIERICTLSYYDERSEITHEVKLRIVQENYSNEVLCDNTIYFNSDGELMDSSIFQFEYKYDTAEDLTLEVSEGTVVLEEPVSIFPNFRKQATHPGYYVYEAYIKFKPNYTDSFLGDNNYLVFMRGEDEISDNIAIVQGYKCSMLFKEGNDIDYIYSKQVLGSFDSPIMFSENEGSVNFTVRQEMKEYGEEKDTSFDQLFYASATYKTDISPYFDYIRLEKELVNDSDPRALISYSYKVKDDVIDDIDLVSELSVKGYFKDGSEPISAYKIYMRKVSQDTIFSDDTFYYFSDGTPVKTYTFESYLGADTLNLTLSDNLGEPVYASIVQRGDAPVHSGCTVYEVFLRLEDNINPSIRDGILTIKAGNKKLKQIQIKQGYRCAYILDPTDQSTKINNNETYNLDVISSGFMVLNIKQERREFNEEGILDIDSSFDLLNDTINISGHENLDTTYNSVGGKIIWNFSGITNNKTITISFSRRYIDLLVPDIYTFTIQLTKREKNYLIKSDYSYIGGEISVSLSGSTIYSVGNSGFSGGVYSIELPFKPKVNHMFASSLSSGIAGTSNTVNNNENLSQGDINEGCVSNKKISLTFDSSIPYDHYGTLTAWYGSSTFRVVFAEITIIQHGQTQYNPSLDD